MRFDWLAAFASDWARLSTAERRMFEEVVRRQFHPACQRFREEPATPWPRSLRVKRVAGAPGVWEMTWSSADPDGRATFEWVEIDDEPGVRWRRIGGHGIFGRP